MNLVTGKITALEPDDIEPGKPRPVAHHRSIGNHVVLDSGHAADHGMLADAHELMHRRKPAENRVVGDLNVPGKGRVVRHDDVVADLAIVGDMTADHE